MIELFANCTFLRFIIHHLHDFFGHSALRISSAMIFMGRST
jgi:hypothetical protein